MATLVFVGNYNNKRNNFVKNQELSEIEVENIAYFSKINFMHNDGLTTNQVVNQWNYNWDPDYLFEYDDEIPDPSLTPIKSDSRWFVIEFKKIRGRQYLATLQRDIVADKYNSIINAPAYIEKATLPDTDKMIYNNEGLAVNQIKTEEYLLKDATAVGWIVGYLARVQPGEVDSDISISAVNNRPYDYTFSTFELTFGIAIDSPSNPINARLLKDCRITTFRRTFGFKYNDIWGINSSGIAYIDVRDPNQEIPVINAIDPAIIGSSIDISKLRTAYAVGLANRMATFISEFTNNYSIVNVQKNEDFLALNNKIIYDGSSNYYVIKIAPAGSYEQNEIKQYNDAFGAVCQAVCSDAVANYNSNTAEPANQLTLQDGGFRILVRANNYVINLEPYILGSIETSISSNRNKLEDAPYDMFCIPYGKINITGTGIDFSTNEQIAQLIAQAIGHQSGSRLMDLQLLPYFPITEYADSTINLDSLSSGIDYSLIQKVEVIEQVETRTNAGIIFYCKKSFGNIAIEFNKMPENIKIENECDMYRLVSPNYQGQFEFNLAKVGGISYFNVDFTYKPFNPYIHVNPDFANLYGRQFGDSRGLVCGGDFSVAVATDQWEQYEINNKNYQNIFDRGIKNLEVMQRQERIGGIANAAVGGIQGGAIGASAGSMAGPYGAIAGAAVGTVAGSVGGVADMALLLERQRENRSYQIDLFNMQLQNIKAMPDSLTKSSALTANNKIFPFLEYYTCTEVEKEALKNKLKYNGMTVGRIGTISEFLQADYSFIQCQLIRLEDAGIDAHQWEAIFETLAKGVYIK